MAFVFDDEKQENSRYVFDDEPEGPVIQASKDFGLFDRIVDTFKDPEKERVKSVQALVDSEALGISPSDAYRYQDAIAEGVKMNKNAIIASRRTNVMDRLSQSWQTGINQNRLGLIGYDYIMTGNPAFLDEMNKVGMPTEDETYVSEGRLEEAFRAAAKMTPMMLHIGKESIEKGLPVSMGAGVAVALLGQAGPQIALPEELVTVPIAAAVGFKAGATGAAFHEALKLESGLAVSEIIQFKDKDGNQIDPDIARAAAFGVGVVNATLELSQIKTLLKTIPGMDKIIGQAVMDTVRSKVLIEKLTAIAGLYAGTIAKETGKEVAQESTNIVFEELAKNVNNAVKGTDIDPTTVDDIVNRLYDTAVESAQAFAVMAAPGNIVRAGMPTKDKAPKKAPETAPTSTTAALATEAATSAPAPRTETPYILGVNEDINGEVSGFTMADPVSGETFEVGAVRSEDKKDKIRIVPDMEAVAAKVDDLREAQNAVPLDVEKQINDLIESDQDIDQAAGRLFGEAEQVADAGKVIDKVVDEPEIVTIEVEPSLAALSLPDFILKAKETARQLFSGKVFKNRADGSDILIPWQGIKHAFSGKVSRNEAAVSLKLNELIESAIPDRVEKDNKGRRNIKAVHHYMAAALIDGGQTKIEVVVREHLDGKRYYDHYEIKGRLAGQSGEPEINQGSHQPFTSRSSASNIDQVSGEVKPALNVAEAVKSINDRIGEKGSIDLEPLVDLGRSIFAEGHQTIEAFTARAKELLSDVWDKVKDLVAQAWNKLKEERGSFSTKPIKTQIRQATGQAKPQDKKVTEMSALNEAFKQAAKAARIAHRAGKAEELQASKERMKWLWRRQQNIRNVRDYFALTDADLRKVSPKNPVFMSNFEFVNYLQDVRMKAALTRENTQEKSALLKTIEEKRLQKVDNYRRALALPTINEMTTQQLREFEKLLEPFQEGDVFLTQRELETVDRTDLKGIRTWREARERLAKETGVELKDLANVMTKWTDHFKWDSALMEKDPFFGLLVGDMTAAELAAGMRVHDIETTVYDLAKKSDQSRKRTLKEKLIPQDEQIMAWLEAPQVEKASIAQTMTGEQLDYAHYMLQYFADALDYLIATKAVDKGRGDYFVHIRKTFLENATEKGLKTAMSEVFQQYQQDQVGFNILDDNTGNILPLEKFFAHALHRTGELDPTKNVTRAFLTYVRTFERKKMFDAIIPKLDIYTQALTPTVYTPRGLEMDQSLKKFVNKWINNKKGRRISFDSTLRQGGPLDVTIRGMRTFVTMLDLGFAIPVGVASFLGEQAATFGVLGPKAMATGVSRMRTDQGKAIIETYRSFIGRSFWENFTAPGKQANERLTDVMFGLFHVATVTANKECLLGMMTESEFQAGELSAERLAEIRLEMGRFRVVPGTGSLVGSTSAGDMVTQYKKWAVPFARSLAFDAARMAKDLKNKPLGEALTTKEAQEIYRFVGLTTAVTLAGMMAAAGDDDDRSFMGGLKFRAWREANTLLQGLSPGLWFSTPRLWVWLGKIGIALDNIGKLETYKTKDGLKGVDQLKREFTPGALRHIGKEDKKDARLR